MTCLRPFPNLDDLGDRAVPRVGGWEGDRDHALGFPPGKHPGWRQRALGLGRPVVSRRDIRSSGLHSSADGSDIVAGRASLDLKSTGAKLCDFENTGTGPAVGDLTCSRSAFGHLAFALQLTVSLALRRRHHDVVQLEHR